MRAFNRILSLVLAAAIAVAGVLTVIEVIAAATDHDPVIVKWHGVVKDLASEKWKTAAPRVTGIILVLVGLLLLFFALRRGKPANIPLTTNAPDTDMTTTRSSLQRSLTAAATSVEGVADAKAKVKRRKVVVKGQAGTTDRAGALAKLNDHLQERLDSMSLATPLRLKVSLGAAPDRGTPEAPSGIGETSGSSGSAGSDGSSDSGRTPAGASAGGSA